MNKEETFQKLTQLFASKINYDGEFNSLFFYKYYHGELKIDFLNQQHYEFILEHLHNEIIEIIGSDVRIGYLNLKTNPLTLKVFAEVENKIVVEADKIKPKEKVELPTIRNKTIKQIEKFMLDEYEKIRKEQLKLIDEYKGKNKYLHESLRWADNWGQINFLGKLNQYLEKIKDYDED